MEASLPPFETLTKETYLAFATHLLSYIQSLEDDRFKDRQTIQEYRQLIWGKKSERHIAALAVLDLDASQPELPFAQLPEVKTSLTISTERGCPKIFGQPRSVLMVRLVFTSGSWANGSSGWLASKSRTARAAICRSLFFPQISWRYSWIVWRSLKRSSSRLCM